MARMSRQDALREMASASAEQRPADLRGADLGYASFDGASFVRANLRGADFTLSVIIDSTFSAANLVEADFTGATADRANFRYAKMNGAILVAATLNDAVFSGAVLTGANFKRSYLVGADFTGANLTDADFTDALYPSGDLPDGWARDRRGRLRRKEESSYPHLSHGASTGALIKARKSTGMDPAKFKKSFPREADSIKAITRGRPLREEVIAEVESAVATRDVTGEPLVWIVTREDYLGMQRISDEPSVVAMFNVDMRAFDGENRAALLRLSETARKRGHPHEKGNLLTVGWVRYLNLPQVILVEEVQSDVDTEIRFLGDRSMFFFLPYAEAFYYDAIGTVFQIAEVEGKPVEMLSYAQKKQWDAPRSVYEDLPRKMGMKKVARSLFAEAQGDVWYYKPNKRRR